MIIAWLIEPRFRILRHLLLLVFLLFMGFQAIFSIFTDIRLIILIFLANFFFSGLCIYATIYILIPKYLYKGKITRFMLLLFLLCATLVGIFGYLALPLYQQHTEGIVPAEEVPIYMILIFMLRTTITIMLICAGATSIELFRRWIIHDRQIEELEQATMETELQQLKNQINPHFLFNMLNNANTLVREDKDKASRVLTQLDDMLRYQLNDSARKAVYLRADIQFLTGFLELEKIRRDKFDFIVSEEGDINSVSVPPFLFIPFVENAIKHNPDSENLSYVHLFFKVRNGALSFVCKNSKPKIPVKKQSGGLGLHNIRRRLELLYKHDYSLETEETDTSYTVFLTLSL